jgi:anti-anti-sigma factor
MALKGDYKASAACNGRPRDVVARYDGRVPNLAKSPRCVAHFQARCGVIRWEPHEDIDRKGAIMRFQSTNNNLGHVPATHVVQLTEPEYGSLDAEKLARVRRLLLTHAERPGLGCLVIDLSAVHFFGAGFIGTLMCAWDRLRQRDRKLALCGLTPYCSKLIRILHLDKLFEVYPTRRAALADIGQCVHDNGSAPCAGIRVRKSDVDWDPNMVRLEYIGEDNVPFRAIIVPRNENRLMSEWQGS